MSSFKHNPSIGQKGTTFCSECKGQLLLIICVEVNQTLHWYNDDQKRIVLFSGQPLIWKQQAVIDSLGTTYNSSNTLILFT